MTNKPDEQGKGLTISGLNWFGGELLQVTKVGVSLRQYNDIAIIDIFNKKKVLQSSIPWFGLFLFAVVNYIFESYRNTYSS